MNHDALKKDQIIVSNNANDKCDLEFLNGSLKDVHVNFELEKTICIRVGEGKGKRILARNMEGKLYKIISGMSYLDPYRNKKKK